MLVDRTDVSSGTGEGGMKAVWLGRDWLPEFQRTITCGVEVGRGAWVHCTQCPGGGVLGWGGARMLGTLVPTAGALGEQAEPHHRGLWSGVRVAGRISL